jgi:membrane-associated phospholipid phosphatase
VLAPLTFERLAAGFFIALALAAPATEAPRRRRAQVSFLSAAIAIGVLLASQTGIDLRAWLGHAYVVAGYWIPALLVPSHRHAGQFERWLRRVDSRMQRFAIELPTWIVAILEMSYLLCLVLVPIAFVILWLYGTIADVDRFWTVVLLSGFACYSSLPWLVSRPPRLLDPQNTRPLGVRRLNDVVFARVSHGFNTFPSGHVAVSLAAAIQVVALSKAAGSVLIITALAIAMGAVAGRYHYALDVAFGAVLGIAVSVLV